jgi:hypothetical protein
MITAVILQADSLTYKPLEDVGSEMPELQKGSDSITNK